MTTARSTARKPATTTFDLKVMSAKICSPRPPAPAKNASVASPTVVVAAIRSPAGRGESGLLTSAFISHV